MQITATARSLGISKGVSLNTANNAITEYSNYSFNSMAIINGQLHGVNSSGIFLLEGSDDNGTPIAGTFRLALRDFKNDFLKRLLKCYLGVKFTGQLNIKSVNEELSLSAAQSMTATTDNFQTRRVKFGRGDKSRYWSVDISNNNGEDFKVDTLELEAIPIERRVEKGE